MGPALLFIDFLEFFLEPWYKKNSALSRQWPVKTGKLRATGISNFSPTVFLSVCFLHGIADLRDKLLWVLRLVGADVIDVKSWAVIGVAIIPHPCCHSRVGLPDLFVGSLVDGRGKRHRWELLELNVFCVGILPPDGLLGFQVYVSFFELSVVEGHAAIAGVIGLEVQMSGLLHQNLPEGPLLVIGRDGHPQASGLTLG